MMDSKLRTTEGEILRYGIIKNPKKFDSYDQTTATCPICGFAKLYQPDRYSEGQACAGWLHPEVGPVSCLSYVKIMTASKKENIVYRIYNDSKAKWACADKNSWTNNESSGHLWLSLNVAVQALISRREFNETLTLRPYELNRINHKVD